MLKRTLEPEVMESAEEAREYDAMDHSVVNEAFVEDFLAALRSAGIVVDEAGRRLEVLDCGTGTALIPIALCRRGVRVRVTGVDLSEEMLRLARENVARAGFERVIELRLADGKRLPFESGTFGAVMSNSIVHHIAEPARAMAEMARVLASGGALFVRDLLRPESAERVDQLVERYAGGENERQRGLFRDSLHAALTLEEARELVAGLRLAECRVEQTSDRHWTAVGRSR